MAKKMLARDQIHLLFHFQWLQNVSADDAAKKINELYGSKTTSRATAYRWYERFRTEGMQLKDKDRSGRPRKVDHKAIIRHIKANPTLTTRMVVGDFNCSHLLVSLVLRRNGTLHLI